MAEHRFFDQVAQQRKEDYLYSLRQEMRRLQNSSFSVGEIDSVLGDMGYGGFARHYATLGSGLASFTGIQSGYELSQGQDLWRGNSLTTSEKFWNTVDVGVSAAGVFGSVRGANMLVSAPRNAGTLDTIAEGYRLQPYYPPNRGFLGDSTRQTLVPGSVVDRYGSDRGVFVAPDGTPWGARSLPPNSAGAPYNRYRVVRPIEVDRGTTAPWFQQPGLGTQFELPSRVADLLRSGHLERISP